MKPKFGLHDILTFDKDTEQTVKRIADGIPVVLFKITHIEFYAGNQLTTARKARIILYRYKMWNYEDREWQEPTEGYCRPGFFYNGSAWESILHKQNKLLLLIKANIL